MCCLSLCSVDAVNEKIMAFSIFLNYGVCLILLPSLRIHIVLQNYPTKKFFNGKNSQTFSGVLPKNQNLKDLLVY